MSVFYVVIQPSILNVIPACGPVSETVIYPDPQGGIITPQFSRDTPNHLKFKGSYQGGVYGGGVYVIVMEGVKY